MAILRRLAEVDFSQALDADAEERITWLLADFLACTESASDTDLTGTSKALGGSELAARLAIRAGATDLDDVDWHTLHHPGSVIWSAVIGVGQLLRVNGDANRRAARCGYATAATMADLLGPTHRSRWHITATAGAIAAAAAAASVLGLDTDGRERAMSLAAANAGGLALAARERRGAAAFNRSSAAVLGVTAAQAASTGATAVDDPVCSPGGMLDVMQASGEGDEASVRTGIAEASLRRYPVSGFLQSAVEAVANARQMLSGELVCLRLQLAAGVVPLVADEDHGPWWSARLAMLRAWSHADPHDVGIPCVLDDRHDLVELDAAELTPGQARIVVQASGGQSLDQSLSAPHQHTAELPQVLARKWSTVLRLDSNRPITRARELLEH